ncbi:hypothetical protein [Paramagnetospirillum magneticum]|uniref:hypothetical protein n=1 Tax=Paramagnetospirillum magneticum TaxID=84159 RepID=UPI0011D085A8|nr:hypothetical protein [Paramagnetospirillum magneticum]
MGVTNVVGNYMAKLCSANYAMATLDPELFSLASPPVFDGLDVIIIRLSNDAAAELLRSARRRGDVIRRASTGQRWMGAVEDVCLITANPGRRSELAAIGKTISDNIINL